MSTLAPKPPEHTSTGPLSDTLPVGATTADSVDPVARRGRFLLLRKLGEGGMGEVFAAYDEQLDRRVAIKLLHSSHASEEARLRLLREAQALAQISHPNVVTIYEVGQIDGEVFLAMEFVDGVTLSAFQEAEGRKAAEILGAYLDAGRGLAAAHAVGLVHRDFKPTNVMIGRDERVRVLDFGIAHGRGAKPPELADVALPGGMLEGKLTMTGAIMGTPAYMPPEQYLGEGVDARSDQFSFCLALYEALYRKHPFAAENWSKMLQRMLDGGPSPIPAGVDVPPRVVQAIMRGLARKPEDRFPDINALLRALGEAPSDDPSEHSRQRLLFGGICFLGVAGQITRYIIKGQSPQRSPSDLLLISVVGFAIASAGAFIFRKTLLRNGFHRKMASAVLVFLALMSVSRGIGIWRGDGGSDVVVRDLVLFGGASSIAYVFTGIATRVAWIAIIAPFTGILAMTLFPAHAWLAATLAFNISALSTIFQWHALATGPSRPTNA